MIEVSPQTLVSRLVDEFERRRWRDVDSASLNVVRAVENAEGRIDLDALSRAPTRTFLDVNQTSRGELRDAIERAFRGIRLTVRRPPLIPIEQIDSFSRAGAIAAQDVVGIATPKLPLPERTVKEYVSVIVGEPYVETDWGGELSDILTARVTLGGSRITTAFLLKGSGSKAKLRPKDLGRNGDQIRRLSKQGADLYVVQHVGQFDEAVRDEVRDMVLARRSERGEHVVGSVWDGSDCARLFVAHGLIDPATGKPLG